MQRSRRGSNPPSNPPPDQASDHSRLRTGTRRAGASGQHRFPSFGPGPFSEPPTTTRRLGDRRQLALEMMRIASATDAEDLVRTLPRIVQTLEDTILLAKKSGGAAEPSSLHHLLNALEHAMKKGLDLRIAFDPFNDLLGPGWSLYVRQSVLSLLDGIVKGKGAGSPEANLAPLLDRLCLSMLDPDQMVRSMSRNLLFRYIGDARPPSDYRNASQLAAALSGSEIRCRSSYGALGPRELIQMEELSEACRRVLDREEKAARRSLSASDAAAQVPEEGAKSRSLALSRKDINIEGLVINLVRSRDQGTFTEAAETLRGFVTDPISSYAVSSFLYETLSAYPSIKPIGSREADLESGRRMLIAALKEHCRAHESPE